VMGISRFPIRPGVDLKNINSASPRCQRGHAVSNPRPDARGRQAQRPDDFRSDGNAAGDPPQANSGVCATAHRQRFDRRRIRGLTMPPVNRFSLTRRANLNRAIQALFRRADWQKLECYYWSA
jgi:hypothetical protein